MVLFDFDLLEVDFPLLDLRPKLIFYPISENLVKIVARWECRELATNALAQTKRLSKSRAESSEHHLGIFVSELSPCSA